MSSAERVVTNDSVPIYSNREPTASKKQDKNVDKWQKPILIALVVIGIIALAVVGTGLASFGTHQSYWAAGALSNLSQLNAIIMMGVGGGLAALALAGGLASLVKASSKEQELADNQVKNRINALGLDQELEIGEWTYARQLNGNYSRVEKRLNEDSSSQIVVLEQNIPWQQLNENARGYKQTSPTQAEDLLIHPDAIKELLGAAHYTIVRRVDGNYQLVTLAQTKYGQEEKELNLDGEAVPMNQLNTLNQKGLSQNLMFQKSSPVYAADPLIDVKILDTVLEPETFTAVLCVDGKYRCYVKKEASEVIRKSIIYSVAEIQQAIKNNKKVFGRFVETSPLPESSKK